MSRLTLPLSSFLLAQLRLSFKELSAHVCSGSLRLCAATALFLFVNMYHMEGDRESQAAVLRVVERAATGGCESEFMAPLQVSLN